MSFLRRPQPRSRRNRGGLLVRLACACTLIGIGVGLPSMDAHATPVNGTLSLDQVFFKVTKGMATRQILAAPLKARALPGSLKWQYIAGTSVSVPYIGIQFENIPNSNRLTVLVARAGKLPHNSREGYVVRVPLLTQDNSVIITVVDEKGNLEDWNVEYGLHLDQTAIFVDETCTDFSFRIRELRRPRPNLMYVGCQFGSSVRDLNLEMLWQDVDRIEKGKTTITTRGSILTVPLEARFADHTEITGVARNGQKSLYVITYTPFMPSPFELWGGIAFYRTAFAQSNFSSTYSQLGSAFIGQFWYRPEDVPISIMLRGFGSLISFSDRLTPAQNYQESVQTYFTNAELRYAVFDKFGWKVEPLFGGWFFFMNVKSRKFGVQRIIDPILGASISKQIGVHDRLNVTVRLAPLQSYLNPFQFSADQLYEEFAVTYSHSLRRGHKIFATSYIGNLSYTGDGLAKTTGTDLVIGAGYGW